MYLKMKMASAALLPAAFHGCMLVLGAEAWIPSSSQIATVSYWHRFRAQKHFAPGNPSSKPWSSSLFENNGKEPVITLDPIFNDESEVVKQIVELKE